MKFNVGDRVIAMRNIDTWDGHILTGMVGTIKEVASNILVEFDENIGGHNGLISMNKGKDGHCWWMGKAAIQLAPIETKKIVITSDGKETVAKLYDDNTVIKTATAKCSPEDDFDFTIGAKIAFERLTEDKPAPKYYNGKVVCVEKKIGSMYTVGKIYEFKDGKVKIDNGIKLPSHNERITTLAEWNNNPTWYAKFIELVE